MSQNRVRVVIPSAPVQISGALFARADEMAAFLIPIFYSFINAPMTRVRAVSESVISSLSACLPRLWTGRNVHFVCSAHSEQARQTIYLLHAVLEALLHPQDLLLHRQETIIRHLVPAVCAVGFSTSDISKYHTDLQGFVWLCITRLQKSAGEGNQGSSGDEFLQKCSEYYSQSNCMLSSELEDTSSVGAGLCWSCVTMSPREGIKHKIYDCWDKLVHVIHEGGSHNFL